jgi:hypothetical protein
MFRAIVRAILLLTCDATETSHAVANSIFALAFAHTIFVADTLGAVEGTKTLITGAHAILSVAFTLPVAVVLALLAITAFADEPLVALASERILVTESITTAISGAALLIALLAHPLSRALTHTLVPVAVAVTRAFLVRAFPVLAGTALESVVTLANSTF